MTSAEWAKKIVEAANGVPPMSAREMRAHIERKIGRIPDAVWSDVAWNVLMLCDA